MYSRQFWIFLLYLNISIFIVFMNFVEKKYIHTFSLIDFQI